MSQPTPLRTGTTARSIADSTIRIIARDGFDAVSVRQVTQEAGLAPGTVQHHFPSRDDLMRVAMERTADRQLERITDLPAIRDAFRIAQRGLRTLLPLDEARREEAVVWIAFSAAASTRPSLRQAHEQGIALLRRHIRHVIEYAHEVGQTRSGVSLELAAVSLGATIDGLILQGINSSDHGLLLDALDLAISQVIEPGT